MLLSKHLSIKKSFYLTDRKKSMNNGKISISKGKVIKANKLSKLSKRNRVFQDKIFLTNKWASDKKIVS